MSVELKYLNKNYALIEEFFVNTSNEEDIPTNISQILNDLIVFFSITREEARNILIEWLKTTYDVSDEDDLIPSLEFIIDNKLFLYVSTFEVEELFRGMNHDFKHASPRASRIELSIKSNVSYDLYKQIEIKIGHDKFNAKLIDNKTKSESHLYGCMITQINYDDIGTEKVLIVCNNIVID
jgi:hypothetical protein